MSARRNWRTASKEDYLAWHKLLYKKGWVAPLWPKEYGGTGWNVTQRYIFNEECAQRRNADDAAVRPQHGRAGDLHLRQRRAEEEVSCRAFFPARTGGARAIPSRARARTSPRLRTRAVREGDHYIVNGQKTWTTLAQFADWIFCLVRTDTEVKQQEGITFLLIDMKTPGITVKPIIVLDGAHEVNEVFFDNVKVPVENRVGEENKGWTYAKFLLVHERSGIAGVARSKKAVERLKEIAGAELIDGTPLIDDEDFARKIADLEIDLAALEFTELRTLAEEVQGPDGGTGKLDPQDPRHRNPAAHHRADGRGDRLLRLSRTSARSAATNSSVRTMRSARPDTISTCARPRSTAARTKSSATSSPRPCWASEGTRTMDFSFTEEQTLLRNSVSKYLADKYTFETWRKFTRSEPGCDPSTGSSSPNWACSRRRCPKSMAGWAAVRSTP